MKGLRISLLIISTICVFDLTSHQTSLETNQIINHQAIIYSYGDQTVPSYIFRDNTPRNNLMNDTIANLGRVLFYDKNLSANNTVSCGSCHQQAFAFGDQRTQSKGFSQALSKRHSMRLVNVRFGQATSLFWDERAKSLESQTTQPIRDHIEMGFSGEEGNPSFDDLMSKLQNINFYKRLFSDAFGDNIITEKRIQFALAQFIRSVQSYDSKYDVGRAQVNNDLTDFPNFTAQENLGKRLFMLTKTNDGADCQNCHRAPAFDIDPDSNNNGIFSVAGDPHSIDILNTRSPSLRDLVNPSGKLNGPMMHDGSLNSLESVIDHYDQIPGDARNMPRLDSRLENSTRTGGQRLHLTQVEKDALVAFLKTLTGSNIYTDKKWSDPFNQFGELIF